MGGHQYEHHPAAFYLIYRLLVTTALNLSDIAKRTNSTRAIVQHVMDKIRIERPPYLPKSIGIDEFHGSIGSYNRKTKRYDTKKCHCVITDTDEDAVFDVVISPAYGSLHKYFMQYDSSIRSGVRFVSMDMRSGFSRVARECFKYAKICIDPFHVVKLLTDAVSTIRIDEWRRHLDIYKHYLESVSHLSAGEKRNDAKRKQLERNASFIKRSQKVLIAAPGGDSYWAAHCLERLDRLDEIFAISPALRLPHKALMDFYDVERSSEDLRHNLLNDWLSEYLKCDCPPIKQAAHSISLRHSGIERAWKYHKSNVKTEGFNKKIRDIKRAGFGIHDFSNFRKRILLSLGYEHCIEETYAIHQKRAEALCAEAASGGK